MRKPRKQKKQKRHFLYLGFVSPRGFNYESGAAAALWLRSTDGAEVLAVLALSERVDNYRLKQETGAPRPTFATVADVDAVTR